MERFVKGDVVVTPFPFSDLKSSVRRPALVISNPKGDDLILCQITSKGHSKDPYQIRLNTEDFYERGLKIESFIKPSILFTLRKSIILYSVGKVSEKKLKEVEDKVCEIVRS